MFKELIDIDVRKVAAVCGLIIAFGLPIASGQVSLAYIVPAGAIVYVQSWAGFLAWGAGILIGSHAGAALFSPRAPQ
jgi:hypothetical protein